MHLLFPIQNLQLLIFCMDDQEFATNLDLVFLSFFQSKSIKAKHNQSELFLCCFVVLLHLISSFLCIISSFVPYAYIAIESIDCILISLLALNAILLTYSVNKLYLSLLNLFCDFNINLLLFMNSI